MPHYDELSVKKLYPQFKKDPIFMSYFPDKYPAGKGPPREYFFNVMNTVQPDFLHQMMEHANKQRMSATGEIGQKESIKMVPACQDGTGTVWWFCCRRGC